MNTGELIFSFFSLLFVIFMCTLSLLAVNNGTFKKGETQKDDRSAMETSIRTISGIVLFLSLIGMVYVGYNAYSSRR